MKLLLLRIAFTQELCWEVGHHFSVFGVLPYITSKFVQSDWNKVDGPLQPDYLPTHPPKVLQSSLNRLIFTHIHLASLPLSLHFSIELSGHLHTILLLCQRRGVYLGGAFSGLHVPAVKLQPPFQAITMYFSAPETIRYLQSSMRKIFAFVSVSSEAHAELYKSYA